MKYRKKPVVIEAIQWTGDNETEVTLFLNATFRRDPWNWYRLLIPTLDGVVTAIIGDWLIKGVNGELYSCEADIFEKTYEPVKEELKIE